MSVRSVAREDLLSGRRSRGLWVGATLLALLFAVLAYTYNGYRLTPFKEAQAVFRTLALAVGLVYPIAAIVASYGAVSGARESGGMRFLLSLPNTRRDVFLGKLAGRLALAAVAFAVPFVAAASMTAAMRGVVPLGTALLVGVLSVCYGAVFVSLAVSLSAAFAAKSRAITASIAAYFLLVLSGFIPFLDPGALVRMVHTDVLQAAPNTALYDAVSHLTPFTAFRNAMNLAFPPELQASVFRTTGELPAYLSPSASLVILAAWFVVPPIVGYRRFNRSDLA